jgi:hypothetical protein
MERSPVQHGRNRAAILDLSYRKDLLVTRAVGLVAIKLLGKYDMAAICQQGARPERPLSSLCQVGLAKPSTFDLSQRG